MKWMRKLSLLSPKPFSFLFSPIPRYPKALEVHLLLYTYRHLVPCETLFHWVQAKLHIGDNVRIDLQYLFLVRKQTCVDCDLITVVCTD